MIKQNCINLRGIVNTVCLIEPLSMEKVNNHRMLLEETLRTCTQYLTAEHTEESEEHRAKTFHSLVLRGKLRTAVQWITEQDMGGILQHTELCTSTGERVMEVLRTKHTEACPLAAASLESYPDRPLDLVPVDTTGDTNPDVVGRISGGAGPGGTDSVRLQH